MFAVLYKGVYNISSIDFFEVVKNEIEHIGYHVITSEYRNAHQRLVIRDREGYLYYSNYSNIKSGKSPMMVRESNPFGERNIRQYILNNTLDVTLISVRWGKDIILTLRCKCGRVYRTTWAHLCGRRQSICQVCSQKQNGERRRHNVKDVQNEFIRHDIKPLFDFYINCEIPLPCENSAGYRGMLSILNLRCGYGVCAFAMRNPFIVYNIDLFLKSTHTGCTLATRTISKRWSANNTPLTFRCKCGQYYTGSWTYIRCSERFRCQNCASKISSYELKTKEYLDYLNVDYIREYKFDDCRNVARLPFDFAIKQGSSVKLLIEVDGQHHFKEIPIWETTNSYRQQRYRDEIKDKYCARNGIPLLRIPYWHFNNGQEYKATIKRELEHLNSKHASG